MTAPLGAGEQAPFGSDWMPACAAMTDPKFAWIPQISTLPDETLIFHPEQPRRVAA